MSFQEFSSWLWSVWTKGPLCTVPFNKQETNNWTLASLLQLPQKNKCFDCCACRKQQQRCGLLGMIFTSISGPGGSAGQNLDQVQNSSCRELRDTVCFLGARMLQACKYWHGTEAVSWQYLPQCPCLSSVIFILGSSITWMYSFKRWD